MKVLCALVACSLIAIPVDEAAALEDPGAPGPYATARTEYDLTDWPVGDPNPMEVKADVHYPSMSPGSGPVAAGGPFPVVVMVHGHFSVYCFDSLDWEDADSDWGTYPCPRGHQPFPSYQGFDYLGDALASHGYITVSISTLGHNIGTGALGFPDGGDETQFARLAALIQHHLGLWQAWASTGGAPFSDPNLFVDQVDLQNVGVLGHSRGGEAVVRHYVENQEDLAPFGVKAVLALEPTAFELVFGPPPAEALPTAGNPLLNDVPVGFVLGYCDGDVRELEGLRLYDAMHYVGAGNTKTFHSILAMGANHAFFNRAWCATAPPYDQLPCPVTLGDAANFNFAGDSYCDATVTGNQRLTREEQEAFAVAYVSAFFRRYLGGEIEFEPVLTGHVPPPPSAQAPELHYAYHAPVSSRLDVNPALDSSALTVNALGGAVSAAGFVDYSLCGPGGTSACIDLSSSQVIADPHFRNRLRLNWDAPASLSNLLQPGGGSVDLGGYYMLQFRAAVNYQESPEGANPDLSVALYDGPSHFQAVRVSDHSDALFFPPGDQTTSGDFSPRKKLLNTVSIPLSAFDQIDLSNVSEVVFFFDEANSLGNVEGEIFVTDLAFATVPGVDDVDRDGVLGVLDDCSELANGGNDQCDGDVDGYGNFCDADLNNDGAVNSSDMTLFSTFFGALDPAVDMNCDGAVNGSDVDAYLAVFNQASAPGPSGLSCAGTVPCD